MSANYPPVDLRLFAMRPGPTAVVPPTGLRPDLGAVWAQPPGFPAQRGSGWAGQPGGWASPPVAPSPSSVDLRQFIGAEWPITIDEMRKKARESIASLKTQLDNVLVQLHQNMMANVLVITTGIVVPPEARTPTAAREFLAAVFEKQGERHGWQPQVIAKYALEIRSVPLGPTVQETVTRILALAAPLETLPGIDDWKQLAERLQQTAALVSVGEMSARTQSIVKEQQLIPRALAAGERMLTIAERASQSFTWGALAAGVALGATTAVLVTAATGAYFAPEIATTARAGKVVAKKGAARAKKAAERL